MFSLPKTNRVRIKILRLKLPNMKLKAEVVDGILTSNHQTHHNNTDAMEASVLEQ
jgi:hypothetical protein